MITLNSMKINIVKFFNFYFCIIDKFNHIVINNYNLITDYFETKRKIISF